LISKIFSFLKKKKTSFVSNYSEHKKEDILKKIEDLIGLKPRNENHFIKAFTHRSYLDQSNVSIKSNERLEYFGDSILSKIVSEYLFINYPKEDEGFLTKSRSHLVNKHSLEKIGFELNLHTLILFNDKYLLNDRKKLSNIVADCLEAIIAAIYLDFGETIVNKFVVNYIIIPQIENGNLDSDKNYKGQLLELSHQNKLNDPIYKVLTQTGPQHDKIYTVQVSVTDEITGIGKGPNKKIAEQKAAKNALSIFNNFSVKQQ
jgi:ribonuclease-3